MNKELTTSPSSVNILENVSDAKGILNKSLVDNPVIQRALNRLKESQIKDNHVSHYTKHSSYSTKHSSNW